MDEARVALMRTLMGAQGYDLLVVRSPHFVRLLTGYQPILGDAAVLFPIAGAITLLAGEDEAAERGWADDVVRVGRDPDDVSLSFGMRAIHELRDRLGQYHRLNKLGHDARSSQPSISSQSPHPDAGWVEVLRAAGHAATWYDCSDILQAGALWRTPREIDGVRAAAGVADRAVIAAIGAIGEGVRSGQVAAAALAVLDVPCLPFVQVAAGLATRAAILPALRTEDAIIAAGDPVVVRVQVAVDGFWAAVSRSIGPLEAIAADGLAAGVARVANGAYAGDIADAILASLAGAGDLPTFVGHGIGFDAADPLARPVFAAGSVDILRPGMTFTLSGAVATAANGAIREDTIVFTDRGVHRLTEAL